MLSQISNTSLFKLCWMCVKQESSLHVWLDRFYISRRGSVFLIFLSTIFFLPELKLLLFISAASLHPSFPVCSFSCLLFFSTPGACSYRTKGRFSSTTWSRRLWWAPGWSCCVCRVCCSTPSAWRWLALPQKGNMSNRFAIALFVLGARHLILC